MSYSLSPLLKPRFFVNATNKPLVGGKLYTYLAGTTTPATTYSTDTGIANTNPIILDANGECNLYLDDDVSYRLILKDANDVTYFDKDRVSSIGGGDYKVLTFNTIDDLRLKIGSEKELVAQTSGYYTVGDGGGNDFYWDSTSSAAENGGSVIKPTLLSGAGRWIQVNQLIFNVRQFGASPTATGTNNRTYINACIDAALAYNANVYVPAGVYNVLANNGLNTGINLKANTNNTLVFFGDGASSVIKRESTATLIGSDSLCWVTSNTDANYLIKDIVFDGNEQNCPINSVFTFAGDGLTTVFNYTNTTSLYPSLITGGVESIVVSNGDTTGSSPNFTFTFLTAPPVGTTIKFSNVYAYEQTSSIRMKSGTGTMNLLQLKNVQCNNNVGDGLMMSAQVKRLQIDGFYAQGRTRRPRSDIQLSRIPTIETSISNVVCDALEFEPSSTNTTHTISFTNIICRATFDIGGDTNFVNVTATNVIQLGTYGIGLPFGNFYKVNGSFTNCRFARVDQIRRCNVVFNDCEFNLFNSKVSLTTADHIQIWHDVAGSYARFNRCAFNVNSPSFSTGYYCQQVVATSDTTRIVEFVDCYTKTSIEFFTKANRNGLMLIDGGKLSATTAICEVENGGTFDTNLDIRNPEQWAASGILKLGAFSATANTVIKLNGSIFYQNASPKIKIVSNTSTIAAASVPTVSVFNSLRVISDTSPIVAALRALPNTTVELAEYSVGTGSYIWRYANGKGLASNSWTPTASI